MHYMYVIASGMLYMYIQVFIYSLRACINIDTLYYMSHSSPK